MPQLVNIFLRGGADGLSVLAPVADPAYFAARPTLAVMAQDGLDVAIDGFAMHPAAPRMADLVRNRVAAVVPAAGYQGQTRSHFESQALLETAVGRTGAPATGAGLGWLSELISNGADDSTDPFRAVAVGGVSLPPSLWGTSDALGVPDPSALRLGSLRIARRGASAGYEVLDSQIAPPTADLTQTWIAPEAAPGATAESVTTAAGVLDRLSSQPISVPDASEFGTGESASAFAAASALLGAGLGTQVVQIDIGDWDTHNSQGTNDGMFAELLAGLDAGIGTLVDRHVGTGDGVVITVMTEFGRRVKENDSGGTDHGRGGLALVIGDGVAGGMRGEWPGLDELDEGDVQAVNDLRVLQSEVAEFVFGTATPVPQGSEPLALFG